MMTIRIIAWQAIPTMTIAIAQNRQVQEVRMNRRLMPVHRVAIRTNRIHRIEANHHIAQAAMVHPARVLVEVLQSQAVKEASDV